MFSKKAVCKHGNLQLWKNQTTLDLLAIITRYVLGKQNRPAEKVYYYYSWGEIKESPIFFFFFLIKLQSTKLLNFNYNLQNSNNKITIYQITSVFLFLSFPFSLLFFFSSLPFVLFPPLSPLFLFSDFLTFIRWRM